MDARWAQLQTELRDLAFVLDRQGSHVAADLACTIAARIDELHDAQPGPLPDSPPPPSPTLRRAGRRPSGGRPNAENPRQSLCLARKHRLR